METRGRAAPQELQTQATRDPRPTGMWAAALGTASARRVVLCPMSRLCPGQAWSPLTTVLFPTGMRHRKVKHTDCVFPFRWGLRTSSSPSLLRWTALHPGVKPKSSEIKGSLNYTELGRGEGSAVTQIPTASSSPARQHTGKCLQQKGLWCVS